MTSSHDNAPAVIRNELPPTDLVTADFSYDLPPELIAQTPARPRDSARLMTVDRFTGELGHHVFSEIDGFLRPGDVLVINDTKVIPARIFGVKDQTGVVMETLLLRQLTPDTWETIMRPGRRGKPGVTLTYGEGRLRGEVVEVRDDGNRVIRFDRSGADLYAALDEIGTMPLPPYITEKLEDQSQYNTVYARERGSAAAPTAGLHFTPELLGRVRAKGVDIVPVLLHVGLGTFRPVKADRLADHVMHSEFITVTEDAAKRINERKGRLICVGTTSCRTVESAADEDGKINPVACDTGIFIYPGYRFKAMEGLITNFHLPQSTLLMLVSAFSSREIMLEAYRTAVEMRYRFFSFGDAMMIT
ncbi:MAG: tRNA preQ1(34) S-adenosylmethionine ribosyltransferase-isomerase QueA [Clostridiales bacterium]|nr:tRNA preQ1(34) S-adenosylmethionine ribosyltransferase-isomerase QueA [Clostridiales bacterium]